MRTTFVIVAMIVGGMTAVVSAWLLWRPIPAIEIVVPDSGSTRFEFDGPVRGRGWAVPDRSTMQMTARDASLDIQFQGDRDCEILFRIAAPSDPDMARQMTVTVNDAPIALKSTTDERGGLIFAGFVPFAAIARHRPEAVLAFHQLPPEERPASASQPTIHPWAFDWIRLRSASGSDVHNAVEIEFDKPVAGTGWSSPEGSRTWTIAPVSTLDLGALQVRDYTLALRAAWGMSPAILESVTIDVNGVPVPLTSTADGAGRIYRGVVGASVITRDPGAVTVAIKVSSVIVPKAVGMGEDTRTLGLMVDWFRLRPALKDAGTLDPPPAAPNPN